MIEATYGMNEYIKAAVSAGGLDTGNFYPGSQAPMTEESNTFVMYRVAPNDVYDLYGLKRDTITYTFYNSDFDTLHKVVRLAMAAVNVEDIEATSLSEPGVTYQESNMVVGSVGETTDVDGEEFYYINAEIRMLYTEA